MARTDEDVCALCVGGCPLSVHITLLRLGGMWDYLCSLMFYGGCRETALVCFLQPSLSLECDPRKTDVGQPVGGVLLYSE